MDFLPHHSFAIPDKTYMGIVKREISKIAHASGFEEGQRGRIDIIVSEMTSNLVKHQVEGGEILIKIFETESDSGIEIISLDNGPGMHDVNYMLTDGVSTFGSKGEGLGAIKRLSDDFDIYSSVTSGTAILSRIYLKKNEGKSKPGLEVKAVCIPKKGESLSGDAGGFKITDNRICIIAMDGLGHGEEANMAAVRAVATFQKSNIHSPSAIIKLIHEEIRKTRGGVGAISLIDAAENKLIFCGIGNISGKIWSKETVKSLVSYNGTIGFTVPSQYNDHIHEWNSSSILIMHSDGIKTRWELNKYIGLEHCDGSLIAAIIYKDNTRGTDDNLVIVAKSFNRKVV